MLSPNQDGAASNYQSVWVYPTSPTTPYRSPDSQHQQSRYLLLDPRVSDADGRAGRDEWWFVIERNWPSGFDPQAHGDWGRLVNFHNVAGDVGWDSGEWCFGVGVGLVVGCLGAAVLALSTTMAASRIICRHPSRDAFRYLCGAFHRRSHRWHHSSGGGADGLGRRGRPAPRSISATSTPSQRADGVTQKWMQLWGRRLHPQTLPKPSTQSFVLTRARATLAEALAEPPQRDRHDCTRSVLHRQRREPRSTDGHRGHLSPDEHHSHPGESRRHRASDDPTQHPGASSDRPRSGERRPAVRRPRRHGPWDDRDRARVPVGLGTTQQPDISR